MGPVFAGEYSRCSDKDTNHHCYLPNNSLVSRKVKHASISSENVPFFLYATGHITSALPVWL